MSAELIDMTPFEPVLDPIERISEILFGTIMVLTFTCSLAIATADNITIRTMLIGAIGCNVAWGIIDASIYLLARVNDRGRKMLMLRAIRQAVNVESAQRVIAEALPPMVAAILRTEELESIRRKLHETSISESHPGLSKNDFLGALGIALLSILSTFPIVIPFVFFVDPKLALRISNLIAIGMLFCCGYVFGVRCGLSPFKTGFSMVALGGGLVGIAIALGG